MNGIYLVVITQERMIMFDINDWRYDEIDETYTLTIDLCTLLGQHCPEDHNNNSIIEWMQDGAPDNFFGNVMLWMDDLKWDSEADSVTLILERKKGVVHLTNVLTQYLLHLDPIPLEVLRIMNGTHNSTRVSFRWDKFIETTDGNDFVLYFFDKQFAKWRYYILGFDGYTPFAMVREVVDLLN